MTLSDTLREFTELNKMTFACTSLTKPESLESYTSIAVTLVMLFFRRCVTVWSLLVIFDMTQPRSQDLLSYHPRGGKMRDPGNEVEYDSQKTFFSSIYSNI